MNRPRTIGLLLAAAAGALLAGCGDDHIEDRPGDRVSGRAIVREVDPDCGQCHTLAAADLGGTIGPNLDERQPGYQMVLDALRDGPGLMPSYEGSLSARQMHDVAAYIPGATRRPGPGEGGDE